MKLGATVICMVGISLSLFEAVAGSRVSRREASKVKDAGKAENPVKKPTSIPERKPRRRTSKSAAVHEPIGQHPTKGSEEYKKRATSQGQERQSTKSAEQQPDTMQIQKLKKQYPTFLSKYNIDQIHTEKEFLETTMSDRLKTKFTQFKHWEEFIDGIYENMLENKEDTVFLLRHGINCTDYFVINSILYEIRSGDWCLKELAEVCFDYYQSTLLTDDFQYVEFNRISEETLAAIRNVDNRWHQEQAIRLLMYNDQTLVRSFLPLREYPSTIDEFLAWSTFGQTRDDSEIASLAKLRDDYPWPSVALRIPNKEILASLYDGQDKSWMSLLKKIALMGTHEEDLEKMVDFVNLELREMGIGNLISHALEVMPPLCPQGKCDLSKESILKKLQVVVHKQIVDCVISTGYPLAMLKSIMSTEHANRFDKGIIKSLCQGKTLSDCVQALKKAAN